MKVELMNVFCKRRSIRNYTGEAIDDKKLELVIQSGLLSASSRGIRPWELIVVKDHKMLMKMSKCRIGSSKMLEKASCAIVVIGDSKKSDVWIEDCSIVMSNMHLMADYLEIGSCWIQGRLRESENQSTEEYLRDLLNFPEEYKLEAILSLGVINKQAEPHQLDNLLYDKIHYEKF